VKVLVIGDGMGSAQIRAGRLGNGGPLFFEQFPSSGTMTTESADNDITDSAASATAMATGQKVNNYVVAQAIPGDGGDLTSIVELYEACGFQTGIVTNSRVTHATPASFAAHHPTRWEEGAILEDYLSGDAADIIVGGGLDGFESPPDRHAGVRVLDEKQEFLELSATPDIPLLVMLGDDHLPYEADRDAQRSLLEELAVHTLTLLDDGETPVFLLIEGARIDHAGHSNDFPRMWPEVIALSETVAAIAEHLAESSSFIFVTGDHETGALQGVQSTSEGVRGTWGSEQHTGVPVPYFASGSLPVDLPEEIDNTYVFELFTGRAKSE
jgi:alkaline phosphatase